MNMNSHLGIVYILSLKAWAFGNNHIYFNKIAL